MDAADDLTCAEADLLPSALGRSRDVVERAAQDFALTAAREDFDPARFEWRNADGVRAALATGAVTDAEDAAALAWLIERAEAGDVETARILVALMRWACGCAPPGERMHELAGLARRARLAAAFAPRIPALTIPARRPSCFVRRGHERRPGSVRRAGRRSTSRAGPPSDEGDEGEPAGGGPIEAGRRVR